MLLVDDFEAVFFLRPGGFSRGAGTAAEEKQEAEQQQGEPFWCPVGVVVSSLAVKDAAVVRVHFLCCSEVVRVSNTHLVGITQQEYQVGGCAGYNGRRNGWGLGRTPQPPTASGQAGCIDSTG